MPLQRTVAGVAASLAVSAGVASCHQPSAPAPVTAPAPVQATAPGGPPQIPPAGTLTGTLTETYDAHEFTLKLPKTCEASKREMVDFDLYYVTTREPDGSAADLIGIYAGNAPGFPHTPEAQIRDGTLGDRPVRIAESSAGGKSSREYLVSRETGGFPTRFHLWYVDQTPGRAQLADEILQTFKLK